MIWKTAWKNVWRNRVRSLVVISSVTIGIFAGVFSVALMNGMIQQRVDDALNEEISDIQITNRNFRISNDPKLIIKDPSEVMKVVHSVNGVDAAVERTVITGMANTAFKSTGVQITGIDPVKEKQVFTLYKEIIPGTGGYFEDDSEHNPVMIGEDLAKELGIVRYYVDSSTVSSLKQKGVPAAITGKLKPVLDMRFTGEKQFVRKMNSLFTAKESKKYGQLIKNEAWTYRKNSRMTLTFLDKDNNQVGAMFRITGIYNIPNSVFEKSMVFVRNSDLRRLTSLPDSACHEIIVKIADIDQTVPITDKLASMLPAEEVLSWKKLQPDLAMMTDMVQQFYFIFGIIILAALAFGIVNTMLMVVLERTKEIGMLTAIGMNKKKVFSMIMLESVFLSLIGGIAGMIVSYVIVRLTAHTGIDLTRYAEGFAALGYSADVYPTITAGFFGVVTVLIIITGILSSVYPAMKALKLNPVEAIRTE